jgi:transcriptional regulator with XRE-family HTH domain
MARLRAEGLTFAEVGRRLGVTRQCVQSQLARMVREAAMISRPSVTCAGCGGTIVSAGVLPSDAGNALCLSCLDARPGAPFHHQLKALRLAAGLTKAELAQRAGLELCHVWHYEEGRCEPRPANRERLVAVLGSRLLGRESKDAGRRRRRPA